MTGAAEVTEFSWEVGIGSRASVDSEAKRGGVDEVSVVTGVVEPS